MNRTILFVGSIFASLQLYAGQMDAFSNSTGHLPNLEAMQQEFVLETRQILIPGYPDAFNPSVVIWEGERLMSFRARDPNTQSTHLVGFVWLDDQFNLKSSPQLLEWPEKYYKGSFSVQDPRLLVVADELYMVYSSVVQMPYGPQRRVAVAKLDVNQGHISVAADWALTDFEFHNPMRIEKNWIPFAYADRLLLSYSICPHLIFKPYLDESACNTIAVSSSDVAWDWGPLRGGTTALDMGNGDYLTFFHSSKEMKTEHSKGKKISHYFMGAYTFKTAPPFEMTSISPEPIIARGFYSPPEYKTWKPLRAIFPTGFIMDENSIWVFYGRQDHEVWVIHLDKEGLMSHLKPTQSLKIDEIDIP